MNRKLRISMNSPAVLTFGLLCLAALILNKVTDGYSNMAYFTTYRTSFRSPLTYVRLFTHVLGHSSWEHFIGNMSYILLLGPLLEEKYGSRIIVEIIFVVALTTGLINTIFFPGCGLLGASGVCFAFILLSSFTGVKFGEIPITFILVAVIYLGQQIYQGIFVTDNVANFAHVAGGIVGAVCGFAFIRHQK